MPVFISHRTADDTFAQNVANRLMTRHGIFVYLDDIDKQVSGARGTPAITALLIDRISKCTNLLAIVTQNTKGSWWVPFEIGVARQAPRVITSMTNQQDSDLPEFLLEWPRLRGDAAIDTFAQLYKSQRDVLTERVVKKQASFSAQVSDVEQFQMKLMRSLGQ